MRWTWRFWILEKCLLDVGISEIVELFGGGWRIKTNF